MYNFFNRNRVLQSLFLLFFLGWGIFLLLTHSATFDFEWSPVMTLFFPMVSSSSLLLRILTILILCTTLILCQLFFRKYDFFDTLSYYPSVFFLVIVLLSGIYIKSLFPLIFLFILVLILLINVDYTLSVVKGRIFISGILIGIISFLNVSAVLLLFFLLLSLISHRFIRLKDVCVAFFGFVFPIIYFLSYYFLTDQFGKIIELFSHLSVFGFAKSFIDISVFQLIKLLWFIIIMLYFLMWLRLQYTSKLIVLRRRLVSIDAMSIILLCMLFLSNSSYTEAPLYLALPFTVYFSLATREQRRWIFHDILILITLLLLCL